MLLLLFSLFLLYSLHFILFVVKFFLLFLLSSYTCICVWFYENFNLLRIIDCFRLSIGKIFCCYFHMREWKKYKKLFDNAQQTMKTHQQYNIRLFNTITKQTTTKEENEGVSESIEWKVQFELICCVLLWGCRSAII